MDWMKELQASVDKKYLIQSMMLLDTKYNADFELKDFSENSIREYSEYIGENYSAKQRNILKSAFQYLADAFSEKQEQITQMNIPMMVYLADVAEDAEIEPEVFRDWWGYFSEEDELMELYNLFGSLESADAEKIKCRLAIMLKSFYRYCRLI